MELSGMDIPETAFVLFFWLVVVAGSSLLVAGALHAAIWLHDKIAISDPVEEHAERPNPL